MLPEVPVRSRAGTRPPSFLMVRVRPLKLKFARLLKSVAEEKDLAPEKAWVPARVATLVERWASGSVPERLAALV